MEDCRRACGDASGSGWGAAKLRAAFDFFVQAHQTFRPAVAIHKFLREHGAQPAFQRTSAGEGFEF
jgi:hypothetical protein